MSDVITFDLDAEDRMGPVARARITVPVAPRGERASPAMGTESRGFEKVKELISGRALRRRGEERGG